MNSYGEVMGRWPEHKIDRPMAGELCERDIIRTQNEPAMLLTIIPLPEDKRRIIGIYLNTQTKYDHVLSNNSGMVRLEKGSYENTYRVCIEL
jgi:hypothetical protein